jgi:hypothetical protein
MNGETVPDYNDADFDDWFNVVDYGESEDELDKNVSVDKGKTQSSTMQEKHVEHVEHVEEFEEGEVCRFCVEDPSGTCPDCDVHVPPMRPKAQLVYF